MSNPACELCPCPDICLRREVWCERLRTNPADDQLKRHIVGRSKAEHEPEYPPLATQAANLAQSLWDWATSGFRMASDAEVSRRREICATCSEWDHGAKRCRKCGCFTEGKIRLKTEHCPLDPPKW